MSITLKKGGSLNLSKKEPSLKKILIGLGWDPVASQSIDLDASIFMIGRNGKLPTDEYFIFYNNLKSPDGSVQHTGDNRSGAGDGDDEMILVNLPIISLLVEEIVLVVSIHEAEARRHNFGLLQNSYIRIVDVENNREILRYQLEQEFQMCTEVEFGRLVKQDNDWSFSASGMGTRAGLQTYVDKFV